MVDAPATVGSADVLLTDEQVLAKMNQDRAAMSLKMRTLYSRGSSITDEEQILCHELATSIKKLSETMNSYAIGLEPVTTSIRKGTEASKYAHQPTNNGDLSLTRKDLPKYHVKGKPNRQFERERAFKNIDEFLTAFEEIVSSEDQELTSVWKRYIPLFISDDQKAWMRKEILTCETWDDAKNVMQVL